MLQGEWERDGGGRREGSRRGVIWVEFVHIKLL